MGKTCNYIDRGDPDLPQTRQWIDAKTSPPEEGLYWCNVQFIGNITGREGNEQKEIFFDALNKEWIDIGKEWEGPVNVTHYTDLMPEPNF